MNGVISAFQQGDGQRALKNLVTVEDLILGQVVDYVTDDKRKYIPVTIAMLAQGAFTLTKPNPQVERQFSQLREVWKLKLKAQELLKRSQIA